MRRTAEDTDLSVISTDFLAGSLSYTRSETLHQIMSLRIRFVHHHTVPGATATAAAAWHSGRQQQLRMHACSGCSSSSSSSMSKQPIQGTAKQHQQQQQHYWYDEPGAMALRTVLQLPSWRFQSVVHAEPAIMHYQPDTLALTLTALCAALHLKQQTVTSIIEQRPSLLLQPHEPVQVLQQLATLLGRTTQQTAFLLSPHPQLLAMRPPQLQQHIRAVFEVMHWDTDLASSPHTPVLQASAHLPAAAATGPAAFLQLLAMPVQQTAGRLQDLSHALDAPLPVAAQLVQHHPALLNMSPAVLRSRLFAVAQADGSSCAELLAQLDAQQLQGLSGLLLLSPGRLMAQLQGLEVLLGSLQQQQPQQQQEGILSLGDSGTPNSSSGSDSGPDTRLSARLLLRLGTRVTLADVQVRLVTLQGAARKVPRWGQQLAVAKSGELAVLLSATHEGLAQAKYLAEVMDPDVVGVEPLVGVVSMPSTLFSRQWPGYQAWLSGREA